MRKVAFLGLEFDHLILTEAIEWIEERLDGSCFSYVVTPNVDHLVQLDRRGDENLHAAYQQADLVLCDSRILAMLGKISNIDLKVVPGSDLTRELLGSLSDKRHIAVIGGNNDIAQDLKGMFPENRWSFHVPPMGVLEDADARRKIERFVESAEADLVLFAIGAPQSELCCAEISKNARARGVALCIGASLEFIVGAKSRAPHWMQRSGLEWLFRLISEPRRLWRRYLVLGPRILRLWSNWRKRARL